MRKQMKARLILGWLLVFSLVAAIGYAQEPAARRLSLAEALTLARANNPAYRSTLNNRWAAGSEARSSALRLMTPTASLTGIHTREQGSEQYYTFLQRNVTTPGNSAIGWGVQFNYSLSGGTIADRGLARAELRATDADIAGSLTVLETLVRQQYLTLLRAQAQVGMSQRVVERANQMLDLARARNAVGQGTLIDVRRAEVEQGQAEVGLLRARQTVENAALVLFERLGIPAPTPAAVVLTDSFPVQAPAFSTDSLVELALRENPGLVALRAREHYAAWGVRSAYSQYAPSLNASLGYGRYRYSTANFVGIDTATGVITWADTTRTSIRPWSLNIGVQLPIFDQFQRRVTTARARAAQDDARLAIRSQELAVRADVTAAYLALVAAYRTIGMQLSNRTAAAEALSLATERYRVGSGTFIELLDARVASERADADYVSAVYDYHWAFAALENAVGRPLR
jgi:outer membrane protein